MNPEVEIERMSIRLEEATYAHNDLLTARRESEADYNLAYYKALLTADGKDAEARKYCAKSESAGELLAFRAASDAVDANLELLRALRAILSANQSLLSMVRAQV